MATELNPKDFGAAGNGSTDDTAAIQRALDVAATAANRTDVRLPAGTYRIDGDLTLTLLLSRGGRFVGAGNSGSPAGYGTPGYANRDAGTRLVWGGDPGGTMLEFSGSNGGTIDGVVFVGRTVPLYEYYSVSHSAPSSMPAGQFRVNNATPSSVTTIWVSNTSVEGVDMGWWLDKLPDGTAPEFSVLTNGGTWEYNVSGVTVGSDFRALTVTAASTTGTLNNGEQRGLYPGGRAGILVKQKSADEGGSPAGHACVINSYFLDSDVGVQLDDEVEGKNCADNSFIQCFFDDFGAGIRAQSKQVVNNAVYNCEFSRCDIAIDHEFGGDLRVYGASMNGIGQGGVFLKIRGGGTNASSFLLSGVRLEILASDTVTKPMLLDAAYVGTGETGTQNVLIDAFGWAGDPWNESGTPTPLMAIGPWVNVTMRSSFIKGVLAEMEGTSTHKATLRLEHCRLRFPAASIISVDANSYWEAISCTDEGGVPRDDSGNWPPKLVAGNGLTLTGKTLAVGAGTGIASNTDDVSLTGNALALHNLTSAANKGIYFTGSGTAATYDLSAGGRAIGALTIASGNVIYGTGTNTVAVGTPDAAGLVAKSGTQTGIGGDKTWTGVQTIINDLVLEGNLNTRQMFASAAIAGGAVDLEIDSGTVAVDASAANAYNLTLTGNVTMLSPFSPLGNGQTIQFRIRQDSTGGRTLAWDTAYRFPSATTPSQTSTANKLDHWVFQYVSADGKWDLIADKHNF